MARLPDPFSPRPTPNATGRVVTVSDPGRVARARAQAVADEASTAISLIRGEADARQGVIRAEGDFGRAVFEVGARINDIAKDMRKRKERLDYIRARSRFLQHKTVADSDFNDDDYSTYVERYEERIRKARDEIAVELDNPVMREEFMAETELDIVQGLVRQQDRALSKERDLGRAVLNNTLNAHIEAVSRASDDATRNAIIEESNEAIRIAERHGYISAQEAETERQRFTVTYARNRLAGLSEQETIDILQRSKETPTWASFIPFDERERILQSTLAVVNERAQTQQAFDIANSVIATNPTYTAQVQAAKQIDDADTQKRVMEFIDQNRARKERMEREARDQLASAALEFLTQNPGATMQDIDPKIRLALPADDRAQLEKLVKEREEGRQMSEEEAVDLYGKIRDEYFKNPESVLGWSPLAIERMPAELRNRVIGWRDKVASGDTSIPALESHVTTLANARLAEMGIAENKKRRALFLGRLDQEIARFTEEQGRKPSYSEVEQIANRLTMQVALDQSFWLDAKRFGFELTAEDLERVVVPQKDRDLILDAYFEANGADAPALSEAEIRRRYLLRLERGS